MILSIRGGSFFPVLGRRIMVEDPSGQTQFEYDTWDHLIALTNAKGQRTRFEYDALTGRLTQELRPMNQETSYEYDNLGRLQKIIDAKLQTTEYGYESQGRLQTITYADGKTVTLSYDADGNLAGYDDGITSATYTYDGLGRKLSETVDYGTFTKTFSYTYYQNGLKKTFTGPDGITYEYTYGGNNELREVRIPGVGAITIPEYTWKKPAKMVFPGGSTREYTYDPLMRLKQLTANDPGQNIVLDYQYSYDNTGNIQTKATEHGNYAYGYDSSSRLTSADNPTLRLRSGQALDDEAYTYDTVGNRLTAAGVAGNWSYNTNNELLGFADVEYVYDENGNMIQKKVGTVAVNYIYDVANRLVKVEDNATQAVIAEYYYDPFGRRLWKEVGGTRTYFFYSEEGLIAEYDTTGTEIRSYGYKPDSVWTTDPLFQKVGSAYYWYQNDHLGTPQKLVAMNGAVVWSATYTAFGEAVVGVSTVTNNLRFPGQYEDAETGLHYNYFRYFDPKIGRYLRVDPIGFKSAEVNLYEYSEHNPVNIVDPSGLTHRSDIGTRLDYSCNCGWIDWSHANLGVVDGYFSLWSGPFGIQSNRGYRPSKTGKGFKVIYAQKVTEFESWFFPGGIPVLVVDGSYFVKDNLSLSEQESVALGIFQEVSLRFEQWQSFYPYAWATDSGFSEEDLPSDLIAFYIAVKGYIQNDIRKLCDVILPMEARRVWDKAYGPDGNIGQYKNPDIDFKPIRDYNKYTCACPNKMKWPEELDTIKPAPKGDFWRDWNYTIDGALNY